MKKNRLMKSAFQVVRDIFLPAAAFSMLLVSCEKEADKVTDPVTEEEAVAVVSQALASESGGLALQTSATLLISLTNTSSSNCGIRRDTTISKQGGSNGRTYNYNLNWSRVLSCNGNVPSSYTHTFSGSSSYSSPNLSSTDQSAGSFTIGGLAPGSTDLLVSQTYERNGTQQSKVRNQRSFNSKITITTTAVKISRLTGVVSSGSGTATITGTASTGESFSFSAAITFTGSNKASLAVAGGGTYTLQW